jgi:hypothetical protein
MFPVSRSIEEKFTIAILTHGAQVPEDLVIVEDKRSWQANRGAGTANPRPDLLFEREPMNACFFAVRIYNSVCATPILVAGLRH